MSFEIQNVERKILSILKVLSASPEPLGSREIARQLKAQGVSLTERAVRYHLRYTDESGLTRLISNRYGRVITEKGRAETKNALVKDKVGYAITKIELLSYRTSFDYRDHRGGVPVNVSFFKKASFIKALQAMSPAFENGYCVSRLVAVADGGQKIGDVVVPEGRVGLGTVCSIIINGALLKAGIPIDSRFGGILEIRNSKPMRFAEIIHYNGCSLDPSEIFIKAKMTSVRDAIATGSGSVLANFREIPALCLPVVEQVLRGLGSAGLGGIILRGNTSESVCEIAVEQNKVGLILAGGLNPVTCALEAGLDSENHSMATVVEYSSLVKYTDI